MLCAAVDTRLGVSLLCPAWPRANPGTGASAHRGQPWKRRHRKVQVGNSILRQPKQETKQKNTREWEAKPPKGLQGQLEASDARLQPLLELTRYPIFLLPNSSVSYSSSHRGCMSVISVSNTASPTCRKAFPVPQCLDWKRAALSPGAPGAAAAQVTAPAALRGHVPAGEGFLPRRGQKFRRDACWQHFNPQRPAQHAPLRHCTFNLRATFNEGGKTDKAGMGGEAGVPWQPSVAA